MLKTIWDLFIAFFKIGAFTFGGGYAMLPMIQKEIVEKKNWATDEEILDYFAIGQCTPGVIAVNTATFIGYKIGKIAGGIAATLGVITPSLIIICVIAAMLENFASIPQVQSAFSAIGVAAVVLIIEAVIKMGKKSIKGAYGIIVSISVFVILIFFKISPVIVVASTAVLGILVKNARRAK